MSHHTSVRVLATVVVYLDNKVVIPAREDEGSSVGNIVLNARAANCAAYGPSVDVRLSNIREVPTFR